MVPRPTRNRRLFIEECQEVRRPRARLTAIGCGDSFARPRFRSSAQWRSTAANQTQPAATIRGRLTASRAQPQGYPPTGRGAGGGRGRLSLHQPDAYVARQNGWHLMGSDISRFATNFLGCRPNPKLQSSPKQLQHGARPQRRQKRAVVVNLTVSMIPLPVGVAP